MFLADDAGILGHRTRTIGRPTRVLFVYLPPEADLAVDRFRSFALTPGLRFMQIYPDTPRPDGIRSLEKFEKMG